MHNYNVDDEITAKIVANYNEDIKNQEIFNALINIESVLNSYEIDSLLEFQMSNKRTYLGKNIKIRNLNAFTNDDIDKYNSIDKEFSCSIDAINFELNSLNKLKKKILVDFNISYAVKINDKINKLAIKLSEIESNIGKYNNEIANIEQDYMCTYEKMLVEINKKNKFLKGDLEKKFDTNMINNYLYNNVVEKVKEILKDFDNTKVMQILNNNRIKAILKDYHNEFVLELGYVGTDN